jgi:ParB-like chromosome segregation protein Spo0J
MARKKKEVGVDNKKNSGGVVEVNCAYDKLVPIADLKPNPGNPNMHPVKQIEMLAKIIAHRGWRAPITVSTRSGQIVRGHGRLEAAKSLGLTEVPVDFQDYKSAEEEHADLLADNKIAELAFLNDILITDMLKTFDSSYDPELLGFSGDELAKYLDSVAKPIDDDLGAPDDVPELFGVVIECQTDAEQRDLIEELTERGLKCRALM